MAATPPSPPRRWFQTGGFAVGLGLALLVIAVVVIRARPAVEQDRKNLTLNPQALASLPTTTVEVRSDDDPRFGNPNARVAVVEFGDFQCPFCRQAYPTIRSLMTRYGDRVVFIYRDYPVSDVHPDAQLAAEAAQCVWAQGANQFWSFHDRVFANQADLSRPALEGYASAAGADPQALATCLAAGTYREEVAADYQDGLRAGVRGTPTFFVNRRRLEGALPEKIFVQVIDAELAAS